MADKALPNNSGKGSTVERPDVSLPIANVARIMKKALPSNVKVSKGAKDAVHDCASEFISFITGEAMEKCKREKRQTITGDDLLYGFEALGFERYVYPLKEYLARYREDQGYISKESAQGETSTVRNDADSAPSVELTLGNPAYGATKTE